MKLNDIVNHATNKNLFLTLDNYITFCSYFLDYIETGLQARIISQNEIHYQFFQYKEEGNYNTTRPINSNLMYDASNFAKATKNFKTIIKILKDKGKPSDELRNTVINTIYTIQQSIGAALDALPSGMSNQARKVNGDLFERFIRLLIVSIGLDCVSGVMQIPVKDENGFELLKASYQHDLLISKEDELKIIGSVKTSSKDRIDKVFMDKFLYSKLTDTALPHVAIFLNDIQRKKTSKKNVFGVSATFLPGHFKAYTIKLNPLDGVYYCDIRPNMITDNLLSQHIKTIDHLFYTDLWELLNREGVGLEEIAIEEKNNNEESS